MSPRERFLACLHQQPADRPAVGNAVSIATIELMEQTGCYFPEAHLDPATMAGLAAAGHDILGYDTIAPVFAVQHEAAALGCTIDWGRKDLMPDVVGKLYTHPDQIRIPADFLAHPACQTVLVALRKLRRSHPHVALIGKVFGPWTLAYHLFGVEAFLIMTLDAPALVHAILERLKGVAVLFAEAQLEAGSDAITLADHATGDLVSAQMYHDFLWPVHCELARSIPGPVLLHICGNTADRLADITRSGFACFHFDSKVPADKARAIVDAEGMERESAAPGLGCSGNAAARPRRKIVLMGNINNPRTLLHGTTCEVAREVAECLRCGIEIIAPECAVPLTTSTENLRAIVSAVQHA